MPANLIDGLCADLEAEHADLDGLLAGLAPADWDRPTPAEGWLIRDQVMHLAYADVMAHLSATDRATFEARRDDEKQRLADREEAMRRGRSLVPADLLAYWRDVRGQMLAAFRAADPSLRVPWFGPDMAIASSITARLMETWAHGQDIADAVGAERKPTPRLRHVAHIGVRARPFSYATRGRKVPSGEIFVELTAPNGETWTWGDPASPNRVRGSALDFSLVVTQRRHPADTDLAVEGPLAEEWIGIAQAFAGPPGPGRKPGQFRRKTS
ncbi:MAG TPA: TIGR03084 family metal-binding protein [Dehalococcoidia bacterium]|nr:TIGR03084 family metal-binding protein [Dehalococcoidia bacterium]